MDWDKLKIFHAAAEAGSFTHAGETLGLSQSAVSRQVSALEQELHVPLFHRHARGLILTEQGELLFRTAHDVFVRLEAARSELTDSRDRPNGELRVTTTIGLGTDWLTPRLGEFGDKYPNIRLTLIFTDEELDLAMREADVALRMRQPVQADLVQRRLFTVHFHAYATTDYLKEHGQPRSYDDLERHRIISFGGGVPSWLLNTNWLEVAGREGREPRRPWIRVNNILALKQAVELGFGIGMLPDYMADQNANLVQLFPDASPGLEAYFVYPQELKTVARVQAFRDFLVSKASRWPH